MDSYRPAVGTPVSELDTPCLLVDMDALDNNLSVVAETYQDTVCKMRQHTKNIKSPRLANMQIQAGGTLNGVCTAKLSEAEVMVEGGITDVLIPNQIVTRDKLARLASLNRQGDVKVTVDNAENIETISEVAAENGVQIGVLIEVDTQMGRGGVRSPEHGVVLAKLAQELPGVSFRGVMSHQSAGGWPDEDERMQISRETMGICLEVKDAIEAEGIPVEMVSSGETFSYYTATQIPGVTEVEGGSYALMGNVYGYMEEFQIANKVLGTIVSTPRPDVGIGDFGMKALSTAAASNATIEGIPGVTIEEVQDDHIVLRSDGSAPLEVGQQFMLLPGYQDHLINRFDQYIGVRNGFVEQVWDIPGRGCHH